MKRDLFVERQHFPLASAFTISRGSKTEAAVITCYIHEADKTGRGECVPYARYGETPESVQAEIENLRDAITSGLTRTQLLTTMKPGAARNAVDCALWDIETKLSGQPVYKRLGMTHPHPLTTAYTISLGEAEEMGRQAGAHSHRPLLKVKVGTGDDISRMEAVTKAAPNSRIILDANEGWREDNIRDHLLAAARCGVVLIEQPLPAGQDEVLRDITHTVPICADESVHTLEGLEKLVGLYDAINIKLDKTGGLTAALDLHKRARELGLGIMVGCMVGTSLAMAPAIFLAQDADFVDLDGPLLLAIDRTTPLVYEGSLVHPPEPDLWG